MMLPRSIAWPPNLGPGLFQTNVRLVTEAVPELMSTLPWLLEMLPTLVRPVMTGFEPPEPVMVFDYVLVPANVAVRFTGDAPFTAVTLILSMNDEIVASTSNSVRLTGVPVK